MKEVDEGTECPHSELYAQHPPGLWVGNSVLSF